MSHDSIRLKMRMRWKIDTIQTTFFLSLILSLSLFSSSCHIMNQQAKKTRKKECEERSDFNFISFVNKFFSKKLFFVFFFLFVSFSFSSFLLFPYFFVTKDITRKKKIEQERTERRTRENQKKPIRCSKTSQLIIPIRIKPKDPQTKNKNHLSLF